MAVRKIFKKSLAESLINKGNKLLKIEPNIRKPNYIVFLFEDNDKLQQDLTDILT